MPYPPEIYQEHNTSVLIEIVNRYPLATLISIENNQPLITHVPLIYNNGKLIGHIDKNNPQAKLLTNNNPVTAIFSGPDSYISPSLFAREQLPTWNYIKVHLTGKATAITNTEQIKNTMVEMTSFLEAPDHKYILDANDVKMNQLINYVVGFEIEITHWEGKFKISQDKSDTEKQIAKQQLLSKTHKSIEATVQTLINVKH